MQDIQNTLGNYNFKINKVGVSNVINPISIRKKDNTILNTVGNFSLSVSLENDLKGINMSRLTQLLSDITYNNFVLEDYKEDTKNILLQLCDKLESKDAFLNVKYTYFIDKVAPVSKVKGIMNYDVEIDGSYCNNKYDYTLKVNIPITTLCPCSKAISEYSAHNQRGIVEIYIKVKENVKIEDLIEEIESIGSCDLYPILKRPDEKYVTERAYENPKFVEDIVRDVAQVLYNDDNITYFKVKSTHAESIHPHDAFGEIEIQK
ncbi:MAG: GTP cyclohydrolase FolE2 [Clostridiaceae bacterium]